MTGGLVWRLTSLSIDRMIIVWCHAITADISDEKPLEVSLLLSLAQFTFSNVCSQFLSSCKYTLASFSTFKRETLFCLETGDVLVFTIVAGGMSVISLMDVEGMMSLLSLVVSGIFVFPLLTGDMGQTLCFLQGTGCVILVFSIVMSGMILVFVLFTNEAGLISTPVLLLEVRGGGSIVDSGGELQGREMRGMEVNVRELGGLKIRRREVGTLEVRGCDVGGLEMRGGADCGLTVTRRLQPVIRM
jgi:hypothetical protein